MDKIRYSVYTKILILSTLVMWLAWDIFVEIKFGNPATESTTLLRWAYDHPSVPFLCGIACGHFFFSIRGRITWGQDLDQK